MNPSSVEVAFLSSLMSTKPTRAPEGWTGQHPFKRLFELCLRFPSSPRYLSRYNHARARYTRLTGILRAYDRHITERVDHLPGLFQATSTHVEDNALNVSRTWSDLGSSPTYRIFYHLSLNVTLPLPSSPMILAINPPEARRPHHQLLRHPPVCQSSSDFFSRT